MRIPEIDSLVSLGRKLMFTLVCEVYGKVIKDSDLITFEVTNQSQFEETLELFFGIIVEIKLWFEIIE